MGWYDWFAHFYDSSLETVYRDAREAAADALDLEPTHRVLDVPCGTGQSFDAIAPRVQNGTVIGVDLSRGMLARARKRATAAGWDHVELHEADVVSLEADALGGRVDRLLVFLGLTAFPDPEAALDTLFDLLEPGGRIVVVDVHAERLSFQGRMVNLVARADIQRRAWEGVEARGVDFERHELPPDKRYGGTLYLATARKADDAA